MRLEFDADVPRDEQLQRTAAAKQPGRKHNHKPSAAARDRRKAHAARANQVVGRKARQWKDQVAAYWRGERVDFPRRDW